MSNRYWRVNASGYGCRDCGSVVAEVEVGKHNAFHDRINLMYDAIPARMPVGIPGWTMGSQPMQPEPEPPFPIGAMVRGHDSGVVWGTVTDWRFYPAWGQWMVRVEDKRGGYGLHKPEELELVPKCCGGGTCDDCPARDSDTPPSAENPDKPLVCAVCGEPVWFGRALWHHSDGETKDHAATLTPPEPACTMCGGVGMHRAGCAGIVVVDPPSTGGQIDTFVDPYNAATLTAPERAETYQADTEPPVGSVVRCEGCGNVYLHRARGWLDTNDFIDTTWKAMQSREFCGPLTVIYGPGDGR